MQKGQKATYIAVRLHRDTQYNRTERNMNKHALVLKIQQNITFINQLQY